MELFFADKKIDKDKFFQASKIIFDTLEESVLPLSIFDLIIRVKRADSSIQRNVLELVLKVFPEIEEITLNSQEMYQIRLDKLSSAADMAERILFQFGKSAHVDEIVREINVSLYRLGSNKSVNKSSVLSQLKDKKDIVFQGRTGVYSFLEWEENTDSISSLIRKAFLHYNYPLLHKEIIEYVKNIRPTLKETSIRTITAMEYTKLNGDKFILPEWLSNYKNDVAPKLKKMPVQLSTSKKDIALLEIKNYINMSGPFGCQLIELTKKMASKLNYKKQTIYTIISENKNEFVKFDKENKTWIRLSSIQNITTNVYNWQEIQKELSHDLEGRFNNVYQTIPNSANFQDVLNMLKALIDATTAESGLDGLNEQLLPTFFKFYRHSNDKSDLLNYFKQISTSLDPFLKKILFFVDNAEYNRITLHKQGLGAVIKSLGKLDPDGNRRAQITNYRFAEDMYYAYSNRNTITHDAKLWGKQQLVVNTTYAITIYIFSIYEYYSELEAHLA
ncbi:hypothetical protein [Haliscomenobacter sp.]|uniref:hypothetical protein n=1 Tax=Haliscomenobacter sp. TaxID=2717303 RepID=UPI003BA912C0